MARIIDKSRGEAVGKIEDTGSFSTDDDLLGGYLDDFVENGLMTFVCEHTDTGVNYRIGYIQSGNRGFAKAVLQHLPSPYYGDSEELEELPDYEIEENRQKNDSPIQGKQGMNTINMFTSLASQSSGATRERVDAEWNEVKDEENLPDIVKMLPDFLASSIEKYRVYIQDREDAPDWADVQEGPQGGLYYDIGGPEGQARLGQPESEAPANVPEGLDLRDVEEWIGWDDVDERPGAFAEDEMSIGVKEDGGRVFVTHSGPPGDFDHDVIEHNRNAELVHQAIVDQGVEEGHEVNFADIHINEEIMGVVSEDAGAEDSNSVETYIRENYDWGEREEKIKENHDRDSLISAMAFKCMIGDLDIGGNIVTSSDGEFYPIDMDLSGSFIPDKDERVQETSGVVHGDHDNYWDAAADYGPAEMLDIEPDEIEDRAKELANAVDVDWLRSEMDDDMHGTTEGRRNNHLKNVEYLRGEISGDNDD